MTVVWKVWRPRSIPRLELGRRGERRAAWFYRMRGYRVVGRNVRGGGGELDLVLRRGSLIVFAEVKTRQSLAAGEGFDSVDRRKREQLIRLADRYVAGIDPRAIRIRYDIVSLFWTGRRFLITHFPDAFRTMSDARRPWIWRA